MSKTCPKCGTICGDAQAFCPKCGTRLAAAPQQPYGQRPPQGQPPYGQRPPQGQPPYGQRPPQGQPPYGQQRAGGATVSPSLLTGLKRLFNSTVMQLVSVGCLILGVVVFFVAAANAASSYNTDGLAGGVIFALLLFIAAGIVVLVGIVFNIIGVITVSNENEKFKIAFYSLLAHLGLLLISIILFFSIIDSIMSVLDLDISGLRTISSKSKLFSIFWSLKDVAYAVMFVYVCIGIKEVGAKLGCLDFIGSYNGLVITYLVSVGLSFLGGLISSGLGIVMMFIGWICSVVAFFLYMGYLRKAINAVSRAPVANPNSRY